VFTPVLTLPLIARPPAAAFHVSLAPSASACVIVTVSPSLWVIPLDPIVSVLPVLLFSVNALPPALLRKVRDATVRFAFKFGVRRIVPPKEIVSVVVPVAGAPLGFQLLLVDQSSLFPPPSHVKAAAKVARGAAAKAAALAMAALSQAAARARRERRRT
jgi:hypothetical protein